jgi:methionyl-tRNA synthetase
MIVRTAMNLVVLYAYIMEPFMPHTAGVLKKAFNVDSSTFAPSIWENPRLDLLPAGAAFEILPPLFSKVEAAQIEALELRFGGA